MTRQADLEHRGVDDRLGMNRLQGLSTDLVLVDLFTTVTFLGAHYVVQESLVSLSLTKYVTLDKLTARLSDDRAASSPSVLGRHLATARSTVRSKHG